MVGMSVFDAVVVPAGFVLSRREPPHLWHRPAERSALAAWTGEIAGLLHLTGRPQVCG
jgi:hypothetical protein